MASGTLKRKSLDPVIEIPLTNEDGAAYDLTDCTVFVTMFYPTTLAAAVDDITVTIPLAAAALGIVEDNDLLIVNVDDNLNRERMKVATAPTTLTGGNANCTVAARPYSIPATAAIVYASDYIDGQGANIFVLSQNATFNIGYDGIAPVACTVTAASMTTNYLMSHLVTDVQSGVDTALTAGKVTVGNVGNQLTFTSVTTGAASQVKITSPNAYATDELGIAADEDYGEAAVATTAEAHLQSDIVNVIKFRGREATIVSPATDGIIQYRWQDGDTDIVGTFYFEFTVISVQGRPFFLPETDTTDITVEIVPNEADEVIYDGV